MWAGRVFEFVENFHSEVNLFFNWSEIDIEGDSLFLVLVG
jgi:hypothetical protein